MSIVTEDKEDEVVTGHRERAGWLYFPGEVFSAVADSPKVGQAELHEPQSNGTHSAHRGLRDYCQTNHSETGGHSAV